MGTLFSLPGEQCDLNKVVKERPRREKDLGGRLERGSQAETWERGFHTEGGATAKAMRRQEAVLLIWLPTTLPLGIHTLEHPVP